jgi:hypothetical protein
VPRPFPLDLYPYKGVALVKEFAELYPQLTNQLVDLLRRAEVVDQECSRINGKRPPGERRNLLGVELTARRLECFSRSAPALSAQLQLPDFQNSASMAWPPRRTIDPAMFGPVPYDPRYSSDWAEVREEQAAAAAADQERVAAFYDNQARAREQR